MWTGLASLVVALGSQRGLELEGAVRGAEGPLAGANVFISSARPRRGIGIL
jgi:hypothetical protein